MACQVDRHTTMKEKTPLQRLVDAAGSQGKAGKLMGVSRQTINAWLKKPGRFAAAMAEKALREIKP